MRTGTYREANYAPNPPVRENLEAYLFDELWRISAAINLIVNGHIDVTHVLPKKPREGDYRLADGTNWDPGDGPGMYRYNGSAWVMVDTSELRWDDLRFPADSIRIGGTGAATADTDGSLIFSGTTDNIIQGIAQMPHAWQAATEIRPHIHLQFKTSASANTRWKLEYDIANVNDNFAGTYTSETITVANPQNVNKHAIAAFSGITMTGKKDSCIIKWRISRLANSDAADNDTNAANLLEFDIHYQSNNRGSIAEYPT